MIKFERLETGACLLMEGSLPTLCTEVEIIMRRFRETVSSKLDSDIAEMLIEEIIADSKLSEDEALKKNIERANNLKGECK